MRVAVVPRSEDKPPEAPVRYVSSSSLLRRFKAAREADLAVKADEESVSLNIQKMELNRYYFAELRGEPYLYRKISEHEIEVYGLAEQN